MNLLGIFGNLQAGLRKKVPVVLQNEAAECGLACICMVASFHGHEIDLRQLRQRFLVSLKGTTLANLIEIGSHLKLTARPLSLELDEVRHLQLPCILYWSFNHFVVLERVRSSSVEIVDPALGRSTVEWKELSKHFTGVALELTPNPEFKRAKRKEKLRVRELTGRIVGLKRSLSQIFLLAIAIEVCTIVTPLFVQWVTDEALVTGDEQLVLTSSVAVNYGSKMSTKGWPVQSEAIHAAVTARDATRKAYTLGVKINVDVLDAEDRLYAARTDSIRATFDALQSEVKLKRLTTDLTEYYGAELNRDIYGETKVP